MGKIIMLNSLKKRWANWAGLFLGLTLCIIFGLFQINTAKAQSQELVSISISPDTAQTITAGQTLQFSAQGYDALGNPIAGLTYSWHATNSQGLFEYTAAGQYSVYAYIGDVKSAEVKVTVNHAELDNILASPVNDQTIMAGDTLQFSAKGYDAYDNEISGLTFAWNNASVSGLFNLTQSGDYPVYATASDIRSNIVNIKVIPNTAARAYILPDFPVNIEKGDSFGILALIYDRYDNLVSDGTVVNWSSSNSEFILSETSSITNQGYAYIVVTAPNKYDVSTTITAQSGIATATTEKIATYSQSVLQTIVISPNNNYSLKAGQTVQFSAKGYDQYGRIMNGITFSWTGANQLGLFDKTSAGNYQVYAYSGSVRSNAVNVKITAGSLAKIKFVEPTQEIQVGEQKQYKVSLYDAFDNLISGGSVKWSVENIDGEAAIDANGFLSASKAGKIIIKAGIDGLENFTIVRINPAKEIVAATSSETANKPEVGRPIPSETPNNSAVQDVKSAETEIVTEGVVADNSQKPRSNYIFWLVTALVLAGAGAIGYYIWSSPQSAPKVAENISQPKAMDKPSSSPSAKSSKIKDEPNDIRRW
ncbi:MAG: hypothetical protein M1338_01795 [Patescibacteria group bacterium]|nr:hypothetical protein [Patescibacteria group bacterium]